MRGLVLSRRGQAVPASWEWFETPAGQVADPAGLAGRVGQPVTRIPGTIAAETGMPAREDCDYWYRGRLDAPVAGRIVFEGLATLCEIWIGDALRAESRSMFVPVELEIDLPAGAEIMLAFRALAPELAKAPRRSRWRPAMIVPNGLRHFRTTALGSMPGWCPPSRPVGPYRPITIVPAAGDAPSAADIEALDIRASLDGDDGLLSLRLEVSSRARLPCTIRLECGDHGLDLAPGVSGLVEAQLRMPGIRKWFPHSHGEPVLYPVTLVLDGTRLDLGRTGFREITIDRGGRWPGLRPEGQRHSGLLSWRELDQCRFP